MTTDGMKVVIVGGGVGGVSCAQRLARRRDGIQVELIDRTLRHDFAPSFLWVLSGRRSPEAVSRPLAALRRDGLELTEAEVTGLDPAAGEVATTAGPRGFDELVLAPGGALAADAVPGLAEAAHGFYTREDSERLRDALVAFGGGRVLVVVAPMPFKCPAAPYEAAFLIEDLLRRRSLRQGRRRHCRAAAQVAALLSGRGVGLTTGRRLESVDPDRREARFADGVEPYDLLLAVPPHRPPAFIASSPLAGPQGWIPVDPATLRAARAMSFRVQAVDADGGEGDEFMSSGNRAMAAVRDVLVPVADPDRSTLLSRLSVNDGALVEQAECRWLPSSGRWIET